MILSAYEKDGIGISIDQEWYLDEDVVHEEVYEIFRFIFVAITAMRMLR